MSRRSTPSNATTAWSCPGCARSSIDHDVSYGKRSVNIIDATDPNHPTSITKWTLGANPIRGTGWAAEAVRPQPAVPGRRDVALRFKLDAGTVNLEISNPTSPKIVHVIDIIPPDEDGDNHSMTLANHGRWLVINTEDFSPVASPGVAEFGGWGEVYVYDNRDETHPKLLGTFSTDNSRPPGPTGSTPITTPRSCTTISSSRRGTPMASCGGP